MRGGVPFNLVGYLEVQVVFPTCVGVFRTITDAKSNVPRFPHMRGGVPFGELRTALTDGVFPTCVGVFRVYSMIQFKRWSFPHMRGGVPESCNSMKKLSEFSPHAWGCSGT